MNTAEIRSRRSRSSMLDASVVLVRGAMTSMAARFLGGMKSLALQLTHQVFGKSMKKSNRKKYRFTGIVPTTLGAGIDEPAPLDGTSHG